MTSAVRKAVIPAAGLGTRFLPATKAQPKEMLPIVDTPVIEFAVRELVESGIIDILIITGRGKRAIEDHFDRSLELENHLRRNGRIDLVEDVFPDFGAHIHFIRQKEPRGLGHAVLQAACHVGNEPFVVVLADEIYDSPVPCTKQLIEQYNSLGHSVLGLREVPLSEVERYGIATVEDRGEGNYVIQDLVEKPPPHEAPSQLAVCGRYLLTPQVFECLETTGPGINDEIQLTDALKQLLQKQPIYGTRLLSPVFDVGDKMGFLQATVEYALRRDDLGPAFCEFLVQRLKSVSQRDLPHVAATAEDRV